MNRALHPRDRGDRGTDSFGSSRLGRVAVGTFGLVVGIMDSATHFCFQVKHLVSRHARTIALISLICAFPLNLRCYGVSRPERLRPAFSNGARK